ncbi:MAG: RagB/SusD family nutrient uptake outer membrane protein [Muribaculaceae bacterium]|nr:RagB/SusD family nutrient uptake outer membrane protein [Muribaculaceae bacterium]
MKIKYISALAVGLGLVMTSCDVTDLAPLDSMTDASYWHTTTDLELYANGLYGNLPGASISGDNQSDLMLTQSPSQLLFDEYTISNAPNYWGWTAIRNCNYFMDRYQAVEGEQALINQYVGEVRFIRALLYYSLIVNLGDVPYYDHELSTTDEEALYAPRDPRNYVLGKVIEDLQFAAEWCVDDQGYSGRITCDAAKQQLARVCLYFGTYMKYHNESANNGYGSDNLLQMAAQYSQELMSSNKYAIVQGQNSFGTTNFPDYPLYYQNQFVQESLQGNAEAVLPRYYANNLVMHELGRQAGTGGGSGLGLSKAGVEMYLMANGMPIYNSGSGYKGDNTIFDEVEGRDPRLWQTIANDYRPNWTANASGEDTWRWDYSATVSPNAGLTGYACEKFHSSDQDQWIAQHSYFDWFIYRYAEVLLINAEANAELGQCTQTVLDNTINKLRDRVGMPHLTVNPVADAKPIDYGYTLSPLLYEIRRERAVELINEGFRLGDIKRWNATQLLANPLTMLGCVVSPEMEAFFALPQNGQVSFGGDDHPVYEYDGKKYLQIYQDSYMNSDKRVWTANDRRWLYPIPNAQVVLNPNLTQNPGW